MFQTLAEKLKEVQSSLEKEIVGTFDKILQENIEECSQYHGEIEKDNIFDYVDVHWHFFLDDRRLGFDSPITSQSWTWGTLQIST